jgi:hypothetical protein
MIRAIFLLEKRIIFGEDLERAQHIELACEMSVWAQND